MLLGGNSQELVLCATSSTSSTSSSSTTNSTSSTSSTNENYPGPKRASTVSAGAKGTADGHDHPAIALINLFGLDSKAVLRFEIPSHSCGGCMSKSHLGQGLKRAGLTGDALAVVETIDVTMLDLATKEGQEAVADAFVAGAGADMKVHLPEATNISPRRILEKLARIPEAQQDSLIKALVNESLNHLGRRHPFRYVALNREIDLGGDIRDKHNHVNMRSYRFTDDADYPTGEVKFVLECSVEGEPSADPLKYDGSRPKTVRIFSAGERISHRGLTRACYHEFKPGKLLLELKVLHSSSGVYNVMDHLVYIESTARPHDGSGKDSEHLQEPSVFLVYTHNQLVPENISKDVLQNESAQNSFYALGERVIGKSDGHIAFLSHNMKKLVANQVLPGYGRIRATTGQPIDITKMKGDGLRVQASLLAAMSVDKELMHAGMLVEMIPRERYLERHMFGTAPFVSLESLQTRSFAFISGVLDGMEELEIPKWNSDMHGSKAAPVIMEQFNRLVAIPNGPWHQRVVRKVLGMFPDSTEEDRIGSLIRAKLRIANYTRGHKFKERIIVPLASIVRGNCMHEVGAEPKKITDFVNRPLQYAHFDAPKPEREKLETIKVEENRTSVVNGQVKSAWYGASGSNWLELFKGTDVTLKVQEMLQRSASITACNESFGDPAPGLTKLLVIEVDTSKDYYGLNTRDGAAQVARMRRDWPLRHFLAVPQINQMAREVALNQGILSPSHSDLMLVLARDMLKEAGDQEIFSRLFLREALNVWTDVTPPEALAKDYLMACSAYSSEGEMNAALAKTDGRINPGNRLAVMDARTLSDLDHPAERTDLVLKNPRFIDLEVESKRAFAEDPAFQAVHHDLDLNLLTVADTGSNTEARNTQMAVRFDPSYPKLPQYPTSVLNKALPSHRWYMAGESKAGDGFLMYLDESPHTASFENETHPRLSVETRLLIVDILEVE